MEILLNNLHEKIRETSEHTTAQIEALYETLAIAKQRQDDSYQQALGDLQKQFHTQSELEKAHLESLVLQYLQAQQTMQHELDVCQSKITDQDEELLEWKERYHQLETVASNTNRGQTCIRSSCGITNNNRRIDSPCLWWW